MPATDLAQPPAPIADQRRGRRQRALMGARIVFRDGYCSMGCLILDISDAGALLQPDDIVMCPKTFILKPRLAGQPPRQAEIVWRKGNRIGVRFLQPDLK